MISLRMKSGGAVRALAKGLAAVAVSALTVLASAPASAQSQGATQDRTNCSNYAVNIGGTRSLTVPSGGGGTLTWFSGSATGGANGGTSHTICGWSTSIVTQGSKGTGSAFAGSSGGSLSYSANPGASGTDSFVARITSSYSGGSGQVTVNVTITAPPAPTVGNITATTPYRTLVTMPASISGDATGVEVVSGPSKGTATVSGLSFRYEPYIGQTGTDTFTYRATSAGGNSNVATATVTIQAPAAPTVANISTSTAHNTAVNVSGNVSGEWSRLDVGVPQNGGTASVSGGTMRYTPPTGFYGTDRFAYSATGPGGRSADATVTVTVAPPPAPTAGNLTVDFAYETGKQFTVPVSGEASSISVTSLPSNGSADWFLPTITYTPAAGFYGNDSLRYRVNGPGGSSPEYTVTLRVAAPSAPGAGNVSASTAYETAINIGLTPTGVYSSVSKVADPSNGTVTITGTTARYTPASGFYGTDTFTYRASGPGGNSPTRTVTVTVGTPPAPGAGNVSASTAYETPVNVALTPTGVYSSVAKVGDPSRGSVTITGTTARYTPEAGFYGTDSFTYRASGPGGNSPTRTVTVTVGTPPAPGAGDVSASTSYETAVNIALTPSGEYTSVALGSSPANGSASLTGTTVRYTPAAGFYGTDSFVYRASGPGGNSPTRTVTVTVAAPPAPTASNQSQPVNYESAASFNLAVGGVYDDVQIIAQPGKGGVSLNGARATYTAGAGQLGTDTFTWRASGPGGNSATRTVTMSINTPPAPTANDVTATTAYETATLVAYSVSGATSAPPEITSAPSHGTASVEGAGFRYTPAAGFYGQDTFTYAVEGPGGVSAPATVRVTVSTPPPPTAADTTLSTPFQTAGSRVLPVAGVLTDVVIVAQPTKGAASITGTTLTYTPGAGQHGADQLTYRATGPGGASQTRTVAITIAAPAVPTIADGSISTSFETPGGTTMSVTGYQPVLSIGQAPAHGEVSFSGASVTYTPDAGYYGADTFTVIASNAGGASAPATVNVTVGLPAAPTAQSGSGNLAFGETKTFDLSVGGVVSSVGTVTEPAHGVLSISGTKATYTPAAGYYGADSFRFRAIGPGGQSGPATFSLVVGLPPAPAADDATLTTGYEEPGSLDLPTGGVTQRVYITQGQHGSVTIDGTRVTYTPALGFYGTDSFTYTASGPGGDSRVATVTVVVGLPPAPTAADATLTTTFETTKTAILPVAGVLTSVNIVAQPSHGSASITGTTLTYTPAGGHHGADQLTYKAVGPGGESRVATVAVTVGVPDAPTIGDLNLATDFGQPVTGALTVTGFSPTLSVGDAPNHGSAVVSGRSVTYTPADGFYGADSFTIEATNAGGAALPATVNVTVGLPAAPTLQGATLTTAFETNGEVVLAPAGVWSSLEIVGAPSHGSASIVGQRLVFSPAAGFYGDDSLTVRPIGPGGAGGVAVVEIKVGLPGAPSVNAASIATAYETAGETDLVVSGVFTSLRIVDQPNHGQAILNGERATYTPADGYYGADAFTVEATGPGGVSQVATVAVSVGLPGAPVAAPSLALATPYETPGEVTLAASGVVSGFTLLSQPSHGAAVLVGDRVTYTPAAGYFGADAFQFRAAGPGGNSAPATVRVTVGLPDAPRALAATIETPFETVGSVRLRGEGVFDAFRLEAQPTHGSAVLDNGVVSYTPASGFYGADSFTFAVTGPGGDSTPATVAVTVGLPGKPVASPSSIETAYETPGSTTLRATGVFDGFVIRDHPTHGAVAVQGAVVTYTPAAGYYGADAFTYVAQGPGGESNPATVAVTVIRPGAPVAAADLALSTPYETPVEGRLAATGVVSRLVLASQPAHGRAVLVGDRVTYTPAAAYFGADSFTFIAEGPGGTSAEATVRISVGRPEAPVAAKDLVLTTDYEQPVTGQLSASGVVTSLRLDSQPENGRAVLVGDKVTYTPASEFYGADAFTFVAEGPGGVSAPATVTVKVGLPDAPIAAEGLTLSTPFETPVAGTLSGTGIVDGYDLASQPSNGSVVIEGDTATYTPAKGFAGEDEFTFVARGPGGASAPAVVKVTVGAPEPVALDVAATTGMEEPVQLALGDETDRFIEAAAIVSQPKHGVVVLDGLKATYSPGTRFVGKDSFTFRLNGPGGASEIATATITVEGGPAPEPDSLEKTGLSGEPIVFDVTAGLDNGPFQSVRLIQGGGSTPQGHGGRAVVEGLKVVFYPDADWTGVATFRFAVENRYGWSEPATVTAIVNPRPVTGPVIEVETWQGRPVDVDLMERAEGGPFTAANIVSITPSDAAKVTLRTPTPGQYGLNVVPEGAFSGVVEIRYTLANAFAVSDEGLVRVTVRERPDPSRDPEVAGLINAQTQAAYRFSGVQVANVMRRLESVHGGQARRNSVGLSLVPMESLADIPGDNPIMERQRDYMIAAGMVEHVGGSNGEARPGASGEIGQGHASWWLDGAVDLGFKRRDRVREGFRFSTDGLTAGVDWGVSDNLLVGLGGGFGRDDSRVGLNGTHTTADAYSGFVYGSWQPRRSVFVDGVLGYTAMAYEAKRWAAEASALLDSERDGRQLFGAVSAGWEHRGRRLHYSPYARVEFADIELGGFTETGDDMWALDFEEQKSTRVTAALGVHGDYLFRFRAGDLLPTFRAEYRQEVKNGGETGVRYSDWTESPRYSVELAPYDDKNLVLGVGVTWRGVNGVNWSVDYEGTTVNDTAQDGRVRLSLGVKF
ncbi:autotransporter domain-containing protein [Brevundimonas sp. 357]|nr:autotransporter domain-containing protein [Brevundimonas sp. 357]